MPHAATFTTTSVGRGFGIGSRSSTMGAPIWCRRAASIVVMRVLGCLSFEPQARHCRASDRHSDREG